MNEAAFKRAVKDAFPSLTFSSGSHDRPPSTEMTKIGIHLANVPEGVVLSLKIGDEKPHRFALATEADAMALMKRLASGQVEDRDRDLLILEE